MMNNFDKFKGKKVFIVLKSGMMYNGIIQEITENFLFIKDKFDKPVVINVVDISSLEEK